MELDIPLKNVPLSEQVLDIINNLIKDGTYQAGSQLPPENDLAKRFNVSRATIRKAMSMLSARGLIVQKHGVGTFVSNISKISNPLNEAVEFNDLISRYGYQPGVIFKKIELINAGTKIASALQISKGEKIIRSEKIFTADEVPVIYAVNSINACLFSDDLVTEVLKSPDITEPLYDFFENRVGKRIEYHIASLSATSAQEANFSDLSVEDSVTLLAIEETAYDKDEVALWHSLEYFPQNGQMSFNIIRIRN
jgi:GntR family transcriptional regulator